MFQYVFACKHLCSLFMLLTNIRLSITQIRISNSTHRWRGSGVHKPRTDGSVQKLSQTFIEINVFEISVLPLRRTNNGTVSSILLFRNTLNAKKIMGFFSFISIFLFLFLFFFFKFSLSYTEQKKFSV